MWHIKERGLGIAAEEIAFQSDAFFRELTGLVKEMQGAKEAELPDTDAAMQLPVVIAHYTGMNVKTAWGDEGPAVMPPLVTKNHPLLNAYADSLRQIAAPNVDGDKIIAESRTKPIGRMDRRNARVSGAFSNLQGTMLLPSNLLKDQKLEAEEFAAVILHELGHVFAYFDLVSTTLSTNQILAGLSKKLDQSANIKDREAVLTKVKSVAQLKDLDAEALARSSDRKVIEIVVVSNIARELQSELGMSLFDMNSFEALADQFATRHGAGRYLVTALDKLHKGTRHISYRNLLAYVFIEAVKLACLVAGPLTIGVTWYWLLTACMVDSTTSETELYGTVRTRYERIRQQLVEGMKNPKLTPELQASYAEDLSVIDEILTQVHDRKQLLGYVADFLSPIRRRRISQEKLQRELEQIANNDLFVKAAALRQLGA